VQAALDCAVVDQSHDLVPLGRQQHVRLAHVDRAAEQVRHLAVAVPGRVRLQTTGVALQQQPRGAQLLDLGVDARVLARLQVARQEGQLAVHDQPAADLEDVRALAHQTRVLHHLRAPPARLDDHLGAGAVAGLERARRQEREVAVGGTEQRRALAEQGPVEIGVDAPDGH
jgi:hypothetical protein